MGKCKQCGSAIRKGSPSLGCGRCDGVFHASCVNVPEKNIPYLSLDGVSWRCTLCRDADSEVLSVADDNEINVNRNVDTMSQILQSLRSLQQDVKQLHSDYDNVLQSVKFCSDKISDFEATLKNTNDKLKIVDKLAVEHDKVKAELLIANSKIRDLEQYSRLNNLEIQGVPETSNENVFKIVETIANTVGCFVIMT